MNVSVPPIRILVVDDEERFRANLCRLLGARGLTARSCASGEEALAILENEAFDVVLMDLRMPGMDGTATLEQMRQRGCRAEVIVLTAHASVDLAGQCLKYGACDYLLKPCPTDELLERVGRAYERKLEREGKPAAD
ncbi:MAG: response regulator [Desulfovibrionaceae bacterium]